MHSGRYFGGMNIFRSFMRRPDADQEPQLGPEKDRGIATSPQAPAHHPHAQSHGAPAPDTRRPVHGANNIGAPRDEQGNIDPAERAECDAVWVWLARRQFNPENPAAPQQKYPRDTPLCRCAREGDVAVGSLLLRRVASLGAAPHAPDFLGRTPYSHAAGANRADFLELLASHGADPRQPDAHGNSPLWHACAGGHVGVLDALHRHGALAFIDGGASSQLPDRCGYGGTPTDVATRNGNLGVLRWLERRGALGDVAAPSASSPRETGPTTSGGPDRYLGRLGPTTSTGPGSGGGGPGREQPLVAAACERGFTDVVLFLLLRGAFEGTAADSGSGCGGGLGASSSDRKSGSTVAENVFRCLGGSARAGLRPGILAKASALLEASFTLDTFVLGLCAPPGSDLAASTATATDTAAAATDASTSDAAAAAAAVVRRAHRRQVPPLPHVLGGVPEAADLVAAFAGLPRGGHLRALRRFLAAAARLGFCGAHSEAPAAGGGGGAAAAGAASPQGGAGALQGALGGSMGAVGVGTGAGTLARAREALANPSPPSQQQAQQGEFPDAPTLPSFPSLRERFAARTTMARDQEKKSAAPKEKKHFFLIPPPAQYRDDIAEPEHDPQAEYDWDYD